MAKLFYIENKEEWDKTRNEDVREWINRVGSKLKFLTEKGKKSKSIKGRIISFPVADGKAYYRVDTIRPMTLSYIPFLDCYHAPEYIINNLTKKQVEEIIDREESLNKIFGRV